MRFRFVLIASTIALSGCASIVKGGSQTIAVTTPPTTGAVCVLKNSQASWTVTSPGSVTVERGKRNLEIRCNKPGWQEGYSVIPSGYEDFATGDILAGGLVGLGIDAATGAINQYPSAVQVPMYLLPNSPTATAPVDQ